MALNSMFVILTLFSSNALDCNELNNEIKLGLSGSKDVFISEDTVSSYLFLDYYGNSIYKNTSIWYCINQYLETLISDELALDNYIPFEQTKASIQINFVLQTTHDILTQYQNDITNCLYPVNLCHIISDSLNTIDIADWKLNVDSSTLTSFFTDYNSDHPDHKKYLKSKMAEFDYAPQYFYTILPHLAQTINLRLDTMALFYNNTQDISYCKELMWSYKPEDELYQFFRITSNLLVMYFNTYIGILNDLRITLSTNTINTTTMTNYLAVTFQSAVFCEWMDLSFRILNKTSFDLNITYNDFAGNDFSVFETNCESTFMQYQMYSNDFYCTAYEAPISKPTYWDKNKIWLITVISVVSGCCCCLCCLWIVRNMCKHGGDVGDYEMFAL